VERAPLAALLDLSILHRPLHRLLLHHHPFQHVQQVKSFHQHLERALHVKLAAAMVLSCFLPVQKRLMLSVAAVEDFLSLVLLALI